MTEKQILILDGYWDGINSMDEIFEEFGNMIENVAFVKKEITDSIKTKDKEHIERAINLLWLNSDYGQFIDELNILLLDPNHTCHQEITKTIQDLGSPKSVPFIRKVLETNFDYLEYTCSESRAIAKWFSWALFSIGTKDAINLMREYIDSEDEGIRDEMIYRLNKVK